MPFLIIVKIALSAGGEQTQTTEFAGKLLRIGRGTSNELRLEDPGVQLNHAVIQEVGGNYILRDLGVLSLTTVDGKPVKDAVLGDRGTIRAGPYQLEFSRTTPGSTLRIEYKRVEEAGSASVTSESGEVLIPQATPSVQAPSAASASPSVAPQSGGAGSLPLRSEEEKISLVAAYRLKTRYFSKTTITVVTLVLLLGGAVLAHTLGKRQVFMPGSISMKHRLFANDCVRCHAPWKPVLTVVPDKTCLACHSGPPHFGDRAFGPAPQCASCHVEHKNREVLAAVSDAACVQCHADLKVKDARIQVATKVVSFPAGHPEFAISVIQPGQKAPERIRLDQHARLVDTAAMKLNHKRHLGPDLMGPEGPERLTCASCHRPDERGAYMRRISYEKDCMRCHLLDFDARFSGVTVPHGTQPEEIDRHLRATYAAYYLLEHQAELRVQERAKRVPGVSPPPEEVWVDGMVEKAERVLFSKRGPKSKHGKCLLCHVLEPPGNKLDPDPVANRGSTSRKPMPVVAKTAMPQRWLPNSTFSHTAHNPIKCVSCHEAAPRSEVTTDVLIPSVASCQKCHFQPGGARTQCVECHLYHDRTKPPHPERPYTIEQFQPGQAGFD